MNTSTNTNSSNISSLIINDDFGNKITFNVENPNTTSLACFYIKNEYGEEKLDIVVSKK